MKKNQLGFTVAEMLVTIAILAILASMAVPSMITTIRKNQLNQEVNKVTESLAKTRAKALLERRSRSDASDKYTLSDKVEWDSVKRPPEVINYSYMGFVVGAINGAGATSGDGCFILKHKADVNVQRVILLSRTGAVSAPRNITTCP